MERTCLHVVSLCCCCIKLTFLCYFVKGARQHQGHLHFHPKLFELIFTLCGPSQFMFWLFWKQTWPNLIFKVSMQIISHWTIKNGRRRKTDRSNLQGHIALTLFFSFSGWTFLGLFRNNVSIWSKKNFTYQLNCHIIKNCVFWNLFFYYKMCSLLLINVKFLRNNRQGQRVLTIIFALHMNNSLIFF